MKYQIKEKVFSIADKFNIQDENGNNIYDVVGKIMSLGDKLYIYDLNGKELVYIEQQLFKLLSEYFIYEKGEKVGKVKRELTLFKPKFNIESIYGDLTVEGDIFQHEFIIKNNREIIATVSKKWISWADTYGVDISDNVDHPFVLALVIVLDQIYHNNNTAASSASTSGGN